MVLSPSDLPDPLIGVPDNLAEPIRAYLLKTSETVSELVALMEEGSLLAGTLPKTTTGKGKKAVTKDTYPSAMAAILRRARDHQNKRIVLDTFG